MRADRLLSVLLLLQTRGKLTATMLADELNVSRRTILRDIEALSLSGVPIYAEGGHGGGIALDEGYRTTLTGLQTPEVHTLFVASNTAILSDVGLDGAAERLLLKLLAALPSSQRSTVDHIRQRLMIDPSWWWHTGETPPFWEDLQRAVYEDWLIEVTYEHYNGEIVERVLQPYSLVNKASLWYLVAQREDDMRTYRVARIHALRVLDQTFVRRADFDLRTYWQAHLQDFMQSFSEYQCTLQVHPDKTAFVKWLLPGRWEMIGENEEGWMTLRLAMDSSLMAKMLVFGLGTLCHVVSPPNLADEVRVEAEVLMSHLAF